MKILTNITKFILVLIGASLAQGVVLGLALDQRSDILETLIFAVISGFFCSVLSLCAYLFLGDIWHKIIRPRCNSLHWLVLAALNIMLSLLGLAIVALILSKVFTGLLVVVLAGLVVAGIIFAILFSGVSNNKLVLRVLFFVEACFIVTYLTLPTREAPLEKAEKSNGKFIRVISWNLGLGQPGSAPSPKKYLLDIALSIQQINPDLVLLQEVESSDYTSSLIGKLGPNWKGLRSRTEDGMCTAILSRLPGEFNAALPNAPYGGPAIFTYQGEIPIKFASIHLPPERNAHTRLLYVSMLQALFAQTNQEIVIAGDLNIDTESFWDNLSSVFTDSLATDTETLKKLELLGTDAGQGTAATAVMSRRIDRVYVSPKLRVNRYKVVKGQKRGRMDHDPVMVEIGSDSYQ